MSARIVADVGGSSSRWALIPDSGEARLVDGLPGFNPAVGDGSGLSRALVEEFLPALDSSDVGDIHVYGAGCGSPLRQERMERVIGSVWPAAKIRVESDLLGAAHGLLGRAPGLVLILGTGMNAGWYDGTRLHQPMPSLGFILGDEGSGADLGKSALAAKFHGKMPAAIASIVFPEGMDMDRVSEELYRGDAPQAWLASFAFRLAPLVGSEPFVHALVSARFRLLAGLLVEHFTAERHAQVVATGGVAYGFSGPLAEALNERGIRLSGVQRSPIEGLVRYHSALAR